MFFQDVELAASAISVSEGEESGDCGERSRNVGVVDCSNGGVVPLKSPLDLFGKCYVIFKVFGEVISPRDDAVACDSPLESVVDKGGRSRGRRLVVYPKGQELAMERRCLNRTLDEGRSSKVEGRKTVDEVMCGYALCYVTCD